MILTGRYGQISYDPLGVTPVPLIALNAWKLSQKTDYEDVTCFQDLNKVYVPGLKDISGTIGGYWDSTDLTLFEAVDATTPGMLLLTPNTNEAGFGWKGKAYLDADIDATVKGAPKVSSTFKAAASWTGPTQP
jgi:hypothetical protein